jgi:DNA primase large subunit
MSSTQRQTIKRLNTLLAIPARKKRPSWSQLRKDLVYAIYDRKTVTPTDRLKMTPKTMYAAMETLQSGITDIRTIGRTNFSIDEHELSMYALPGQPIFSRYGDSNCYNAMIHAFRYLVEKAQIRGDQFLTCANSRCQRAFVPLRKTVKGKRAYCTPECGRRVAVWDYRRRKTEELKEKERKRSNQRYKEKARKTREEKAKANKRA